MLLSLKPRKPLFAALIMCVPPGHTGATAQQPAQGHGQGTKGVKALISGSQIFSSWQFTCLFPKISNIGMYYFVIEEKLLCEGNYLKHITFKVFFKVGMERNKHKNKAATASRSMYLLCVDTRFAFSFPAARKHEKCLHSVREIEMNQLLRRTAILRPQSRQEFLPRIC